MDTIESRIAQNIKAALASAIVYGGVPTVELERLFTNINNRYPFIVICGADASVITKTYLISNYEFEYTIKYYIKVNDEKTLANTEITTLTQDVSTGVAKSLVVDRYRGGLAKNTEIRDAGYGVELINDNVEFYVYVAAVVTALTKTNNPYELI